MLAPRLPHSARCALTPFSKLLQHFPTSSSPLLAPAGGSRTGVLDAALDASPATTAASPPASSSGSTSSLDSPRAYKGGCASGASTPDSQASVEQPLSAVAAKLGDRCAWAGEGLHGGWAGGRREGTAKRFRLAACPDTPPCLPATLPPPQVVPHLLPHRHLRLQALPPPRLCLLLPAHRLCGARLRARGGRPRRLSAGPGSDHPGAAARLLHVQRSTISS